MVQQPTVLLAAAIAPRAYFAIPPIAAAPALRRPDKPLLRVPSCRPDSAFGTRLQLLMTAVTQASGNSRRIQGAHRDHDLPTRK
jgi:hypothetical protein